MPLLRFTVKDKQFMRSLRISARDICDLCQDKGCPACVTPKIDDDKE
jgi:hypothetical protein